MDTGQAPAMAFDPLIGATLTLASGSWSPDGTTYTATYDVAGKRALAIGVDILVSGAADVAGNAQSSE